MTVQVFESVPCVYQEVEYYLLKLDGIAFYNHFFLVELQIKFDVLLAFGHEKVNALEYEFVKILSFYYICTFSGEAEQLLRESCRLFRDIAYFFEVTEYIFVFDVISQGEHVHVALYCVQVVVEVVRHAARELAYGLYSLGVGQPQREFFFFSCQLVFLGDVPSQHHHQGDSAHLNAGESHVQLYFFF